MSDFQQSRAVVTALSRRGSVAWTRRPSAAATVVSAAIVFLFFGHRALAVDVLEEVVEQKYDVDANATLTVSNIDGSIRVYGAEAPQIHIQAIKKAYSRERLEGIVVDVK